MWRAYDVIEKECDAKILALWANSPQVLFSKDDPIRTLEDMKGKIVRVTSAQDIPFTEALGSSAVSQPASVINQNLSNGVVDIISIDPSAALSFKLHEVVKGIAPDVPLGTIFRGIWPFWFAMTAVVSLIVLFPSIAIVLPNSMFG